jgi:class 3 adenylate cyclase
MLVFGESVHRVARSYPGDVSIPPGNRRWQPIGRPPNDTGWGPVGQGRPPWLTEAYLDDHAPSDWRERYRTADPWRAVETMSRRPCAVISLDVRGSTEIRRLFDNGLLVEGLFDNFFTGARLTFEDVGLWFDKFLGDGMLAFGPVWGTPDYGVVPLRRFLQVLGEVSALFDAAPLNVLRQTLGPRLPAGAGLAIGVDAGQVSIWPMAGQPELQGEPVITATRMQSVAEAGEIVLAPHLGQTIEHDRVRALPNGMTLSRTRPAPQEPRGECRRLRAALPATAAVQSGGSGAGLGGPRRRSVGAGGARNRPASTTTLPLCYYYVSSTHSVTISATGWILTWRVTPSTAPLKLWTAPAGATTIEPASTSNVSPSTVNSAIPSWTTNVSS